MTRVLLDTQLLIWAGCAPQWLAPSLASELEDRRNDIRYSVASLWDVAIKASLEREDFQVDPSALRQGLLGGGIPGAAHSGGTRFGAAGSAPDSPRSLEFQECRELRS